MVSILAGTAVVIGAMTLTVPVAFVYHFII